MFSFRWLNRQFLGRYSSTVAGPLDGVKVLDLTRVLAGPFCTMGLGDMGADVVKIESPDGGDMTRTWGPPFAGGESAYFMCVNRNKRSVVLDLKTSDGRSMLRRLAQESDILIENFLPGTMDRLGLGYESLRKSNKRLIYATITGYGQSGPYSHKPGYDVIVSAVGGLMSLTGEERGGPVKVGVAVTDVMTGMNVKSGILAALLSRNASGVGQRVDCSLLETQVSSLVNIASNYLIGGREGRRWGTAHESIVPYQAFRTSDGYILVGAANNAQFARLCSGLEYDHLCRDPRFDSNANRVTNRNALVDILSEIFSKQTTDEWLNDLESTGIPIGRINNMEQTFSHPQILHNGMVVEMEHPTAGRVRLVGPPVKFSETPCTVRRPPPLLGQHTDEVIQEWLQ
eukprot:Rmarinus@m.22168